MKKVFDKFPKKLAGKTSVLPVQIHAVKTSALCMLLPGFILKKKLKKKIIKQIWILRKV